MSKRPQGQAVPPEIRERGIAMLRAGTPATEVIKTLGVTGTTVYRWRRALDADAKPTKAKARAKAKAKTTPMNYLADQLTEMTKLIRKALPDLARFTLTTTPDGKASVEYTVRQLSEVSGTVKL